MTAPDPAARAARLRALPAAGFAPAQAKESPDAAFAAAVAAFAAGFWALPPAEQRERYEDFRGRAYGRAVARLVEFAAGLNDPRGSDLPSGPRPAAAVARKLAPARNWAFSTDPQAPPAGVPFRMVAWLPDRPPPPVPLPPPEPLPPPDPASLRRGLAGFGEALVEHAGAARDEERGRRVERAAWVSGCTLPFVLLAVACPVTVCAQWRTGRGGPPPADAPRWYTPTLPTRR